MIEKLDNIILLGTSHVSKDSQKEIIESIEKYTPKIVALELDLQRLKSLTEKPNPNQKKPNMTKQIKQLGLFGFLFVKVAGSVQKNLAKKLGIVAGIDMKTGFDEAKSKEIPIALIDLDIRLTLKKMSKLSFFRKIKMFYSIISGSLKKENRKMLKMDFNKVPDEKTILKMMKILQKSTPDLYKILIEDRNEHMSKKLINLSEKHPKENIIAIVGAGHLERMKKIIKSEQKKLEKLKNQNSISYSFKVQPINNNINL